MASGIDPPDRGALRWRGRGPVHSKACARAPRAASARVWRSSWSGNGRDSRRLRRGLRVDSESGPEPDQEGPNLLRRHVFRVGAAERVGHTTFAGPEKIQLARAGRLRTRVAAERRFHALVSGEDLAGAVENRGRKPGQLRHLDSVALVRASRPDP